MIINILKIFIVMSKPRKELNPKLTKGDRVMCLHMDGETSVPMGTTGTVSRTTRDPFEVDSEIITVDWDNGSTLGLLSATDRWIKEEPKPIEEAKTNTLSTEYNFFSDNPEIFENFDWRFLRKFLMKLREASPVNMFESAPFLYSGKEWIERYYGEDEEDNDAFQEILEMADESKNKMIQGVMKYMDSKDMEIELEKVNRLMRKFSVDILQLYMSFP
jgi:hypothetical protein